MKTLRFALIGAGEFGNFAESVLDMVPNIKLVAVVDTNELAASNLAKKYDAQTFANIRDLLKKIPIDFVMINTPNDTHFELVEFALHANVGVFCEKPLVIKSDQISQLFNLAKPGQLDVDMVLRQASGYTYLKNTVDKNSFLPKSIIIENRATESRITSNWYWDNERSGGWFYTAAIHFLDLILFLYPHIEFTQVKAVLDIDQASGRPIGYRCSLRNAETTFSINHRFDSVDAQIGFDAEFDFGSNVAQLKGWVPTEISWAKSDIEPFRLGIDRETEYRLMVASRLANFCDGLINGVAKINQSEIFRVSQWCELLQSAATKHPNKWVTI